MIVSFVALALSVVALVVAIAVRRYLRGRESPRMNMADLERWGQVVGVERHPRETYASYRARIVAKMEWKPTGDVAGMEKKR